jgi:hypothetical protein
MTSANRRPTMTATLTISPAAAGRRELDHRQSNGIDVTLSWCPIGGELFVTVVDDAGDSFEIAVEPHEALDVFQHPFAYAAVRSVHLLDVVA